MSDNLLVNHLQTLAQQKTWDVHELPETITVDVVYVLGIRGWLEVRYWEGRPLRLVRTIPLAEYDKWIWPVQHPSHRPGTPQLTTFQGESIEVRITEQGATKLREAAVLAVGSKPESPKPTEMPGLEDSRKGTVASPSGRVRRVGSWVLSHIVRASIVTVIGGVLLVLVLRWLGLG